jgi:DNA-binding transcriptional MerR regulator
MLTIGRMATRTGFSASAIRYYERRGLLRPSRRLQNGYRVYEEDAIKDLRILCEAKALGFTLKEIKQLLKLTYEGQNPCRAVRQLARRHRNDIDARIRQLRSLRNRLDNLLSRCLAARSDELCPLISDATGQAAAQSR